MIRKTLKGIDWSLTRLMILILLLLLGVSSYALWDNQQVYRDAENVLSELYQYRPTVDPDTGKADFSQLQAINPDVVAWITLEGTNIDYPVLQGKSNLSYMNTDVYGNYSLAGSIFLDTRNARGFTDPYSLVYGHHMDDHLMFGDLDLYQDETFFEEHRTATITTEDGVMEFQIFASMKIPDNVQEIFNPTMWGSDLSNLIGYIENNAMYVWDPALGDPGENAQRIEIVALVTCASGHTGTRTIVILVRPRDEEVEKPTEPTMPTEAPEIDKPANTGDTVLHSPVLWGAVLAAALTVFVLVCIWERKERDCTDD